MIIYSLVIINELILSMTKRINEKHTFIIGMSLLCFLAAFRDYTIGNDTAYYGVLFDLASEENYIEDFSKRFEILFLIYNKIIRSLTDNYTIYLLITDSVIFFAYTKFIICTSRNMVFSFFVFFFLGMFGQTMNALRMQMGLAFIMLSYVMKIQGNKKVSFIFAILSVGFQKICATYLISYLIENKISKRNYLIGLIISLLSVIYFENIMSYVFKFIPYYELYITSKYSYNDIKPGVFALLLFNISVFIFAYSMYQYYSCIELKTQVKQYLWHLNAFYISIMFLIIALRFNIIDRCSQPFFVFSLPLISNSLFIMKTSKSRQLFYMLFFLYLLAYHFAINYYRPEWNIIYPYKFIFE